MPAKKSETRPARGQSAASKPGNGAKRLNVPGEISQAVSPAAAKRIAKNLAPLGDGRPIASPATVAEIFRRFHAAEPEPKGELEHVNPFTLLVAVVLSAQATDAGVNKATRALFAAADTPQKMLALGEDRVRDHVKTIGLYRAKAKNVILLSEQLLRDHHGVVPADREALVKLAGVGRKTANVVLNMAFGEKTMAVDTHVFRVANRIPLAFGTTPEQIESGLEAVIPDDYMLHAHHWLILHGRYTCKARKPECERCIIADLCTSPEKTVL